MSTKSSVSLVGGGVEFQPVPTSDLPAVVAARKARAQKRIKAIKIGVSVVLLAAALAALSAYLVSPSKVTHPSTPGRGDSGSETIAPRMARSLKEVGGMEEVKEISLGNWNFGVDIFDKISKEKKDNLIFSPYSVSSVMAMLTNGAKGDTLKALQTGMKYPELATMKTGYSALLPHMKSDENITLETANSAFIKNELEILPTFKSDLMASFDSEFQNVDFGASKKAADTLNTWVENKTRNKIKDMFTEDMFSELTSMVLVNAIYFKGDWLSKFDPDSTEKASFTVSADKKVEADMMFQETKFKVGTFKDADVVELPYKGERVSMFVAVPKTRFALPELEKAIVDDPKGWSDELDNVAEEKINFYMPKFKITSVAELTEILKSAGMENAFSLKDADFSGITGSRDTYLSEVLQKAFIEVNEEGSEAAAATGAIMMMRSMPMRSRTISLDQPFLFLIKDKVTGMVLFQGRVTDPTVSE